MPGRCRLPEQSPNTLGKAVRVSRREVGDAPGAVCWFGDDPPDLLGHSRRRVDQLHGRPGELSNQPGHERVVGAPENDAVDVLVGERIDMGPEDGCGRDIVSFLDRQGQSDGCCLDHANAPGMTIDNRGVQVALKRRRGGQDSDDTCLAAEGGRFDGRFHANKRGARIHDVEMTKRCRRHAVARDDHGTGSAGAEEPSYGHGAAPHVVQLPSSVRRKYMVGQIQDRSLGEPGADFEEDRKAADARIEDCDRLLPAVADRPTPAAYR